METADRPAGAAAPLTSQQQFYNNKLYSDITIFFGIGSGLKIHAHKAILAISSTWFRHNLSSADAMELKLEHKEHDAMKRLLRYIYGFPIFPAAFPSTIHMDITLLGLANKYEMSTLIGKAEASITGRLIGMKDDKSLTAATCVEVLDKLYVLPKGDGTLRRLAVEACHRYMAELVADDMFQNTLLKFPEIAVDLMKRPTVTVKTESQESNKRRRV